MEEVRETMWWLKAELPSWEKSSPSWLKRLEETQPMVFALPWRSESEAEEEGKGEETRGWDIQRGLLIK